jgi:hypothetical protein
MLNPALYMSTKHGDEFYVDLTKNTMRVDTSDSDRFGDFAAFLGKTTKKKPEGVVYCDALEQNLNHIQLSKKA